MVQARHADQVRMDKATDVGAAGRVAAALMAAAAAVGGLLFLFIALIQLDPGICGYLAERDCTREELRFDLDSALPLSGFALALTAVVAGFRCALTRRRTLCHYTLAAFAGATAIGIALEILDIPNR